MSKTIEQQVNEFRTMLRQADKKMYGDRADDPELVIARAEEIAEYSMALGVKENLRLGSKYLY